jgi:hypothetical protein
MFRKVSSEFTHTGITGESPCIPDGEIVLSFKKMQKQLTTKIMMKRMNN